MTRRVCLLHDDARLHTANVAKQLLDFFGWNFLNSPPPLFPRLCAFRLLSVHFSENVREWKQIFNGGGDGRQVEDKGDSVRVLREHEQINFLLTTCI